MWTLLFQSLQHYITQSSVLYPDQLIEIHLKEIGTITISKTRILILSAFQYQKKCSQTTHIVLTIRDILFLQSMSQYVSVSFDFYLEYFPKYQHRQTKWVMPEKKLPSISIPQIEPYSGSTVLISVKLKILLI
jgi:hypothetical protein